MPTVVALAAITTIAAGCGGKKDAPITGEAKIERAEGAAPGPTYRKSGTTGTTGTTPDATTTSATGGTGTTSALPAQVPTDVCGLLDDARVASLSLGGGAVAVPAGASVTATAGTAGATVSCRWTLDQPAGSAVYTVSLSAAPGPFPSAGAAVEVAGAPQATTSRTSAAATVTFGGDDVVYAVTVSCAGTEICAPEPMQAAAVEAATDVVRNTAG